jgi:hypothetical protein
MRLFIRECFFFIITRHLHSRLVTMAQNPGASFRIARYPVDPALQLDKYSSFGNIILSL